MKTIYAVSFFDEASRCHWVVQVVASGGHPWPPDEIKRRARAEKPHGWPETEDFDAVAARAAAVFVWATVSGRFDSDG